MVILGLTGPANAGKDTVADMLVEHFGFTKYSFAMPLKNMLRRLFDDMGVDHKWMDDRALKEQTIPQIGKSYRELAQTLGTEWGREHVASDFWAQATLQKIRAEHTDTFGPIKAVISDLRFLNEAKAVRDFGGAVIRINSNRDITAKPHVSELEMASIPVQGVIPNNDDLDGLRYQVFRFVETWPMK